MKTKMLIELLQKEDPSGELEACVGREDILFVARLPADHDGDHEVLIRDWDSPYYNVVGAEIRHQGEKVKIHTLSIEWAIADNPDLPVTCREEYRPEVERWRQEAREIDREIAEGKTAAKKAEDAAR